MKRKFFNILITCFTILFFINEGNSFDFIFGPIDQSNNLNSQSKSEDDGLINIEGNVVEFLKIHSGIYFEKETKRRLILEKNGAFSVESRGQVGYTEPGCMVPYPTICTYRIQGQVIGIRKLEDSELREKCPMNDHEINYKYFKAKLMPGANDYDCEMFIDTINRNNESRQGKFPMGITSKNKITFVHHPIYEITDDLIPNYDPDSCFFQTYFRKSKK